MRLRHRLLGLRSQILQPAAITTVAPTACSVCRLLRGHVVPVLVPVPSTVDDVGGPGIPKQRRNSWKRGAHSFGRRGGQNCLQSVECCNHSSHVKPQGHQLHRCGQLCVCPEQQRQAADFGTQLRKLAGRWKQRFRGIPRQAAEFQLPCSVCRNGFGGGPGNRRHRMHHRLHFGEHLLRRPAAHVHLVIRPHKRQCSCVPRRVADNLVFKRHPSVDVRDECIGDGLRRDSGIHRRDADRGHFSRRYSDRPCHC